MKLKYELNEIAPKVFHVAVEDSYDLAMLFLRAQEFYESPYKEIRGKNFTVLKFMEIYSKERDNVFSYPNDWAGFNIPGKIIKKIYFDSVPEDFNFYDKTLFHIHKEIDSEFNYYLIGTLPDDRDTINHEVAHANFCLNKRYKKESLQIIRKLPVTARKKIEKHLTYIGYDSRVFDDEIQAYICADVYDFLNNIKFNKREIKTIKKAHEELFKLAKSLTS